VEACFSRRKTQSIKKIKKYLQCASIESPSILWVVKDKTYKDTLMNKQMKDGTPKCPLVEKSSNNTDRSYVFLLIILV